MINSRKIEDLTPAMQVLANKFLAICKERQIPVLITCTLRDNEYQDYLYAQGRTRAGAKVTNAKGGESSHNFGVAFDFVPLTDGKPDWNDLSKFRTVGKIAEEVGLEWGGRWVTLTDMPHVQLKGWKKPAKVVKK